MGHFLKKKKMVDVNCTCSDVQWVNIQLAFCQVVEAMSIYIQMELIFHKSYQNAIQSR